MSAIRMISLFLLSALPLAAGAAVTAGDLPANTIWYMHADLERLRNTESGKSIAIWFDAEIGDDLREEMGIDLSKEVNSVTAYSDTTHGTVILVEGPISRKTQEKLVAMATLEGNIDIRKHGGKTYYFADGGHDMSGNNEPLDDLEEAAYFSFAVDGKAIVTSDENHLKAMLDNGGRIVGSDSHDGALFVLTADVSFVQAGLSTDDFGDEGDDGGWESNIIRNTEQAAVLVADQNGRIAVEAQLKSKDPDMARSIAGIVNGLIGLQAFNDELPPEIKSLINNTRVEVIESILKVNTVIEPALIATLLAD